MKNVQRVCATFGLTIVLAIPTLAGEIQTPSAPPAPNSVDVPGEIQTGIASNGATSSNGTETAFPLTEVALDLLQSMMSLF